VYEIKLDGYRILARCEGGKTRLFTRNGNDWTSKMESLAREIATLPVQTAWLDGEAVVLSSIGRESEQH
jgi:bifunctional non-homologous end joining protein LigD